MTQLTATFTVTIKTKPDGDYYFDHDDLVRNVVPWIEGGLDDRDDIAEVTITEQPAAVSAAVAPPTPDADEAALAPLKAKARELEARRRAEHRAAVLREAADAVFALDYDVMVGEEGDENLGSMREAWDVGTIHASQLLRRMADETATETPDAVLTESERKMLAYALDQAQERIWSEGGFTDEDQAAVDSLRRLTTDEPAAGARQDGGQS